MVENRESKKNGELVSFISYDVVHSMSGVTLNTTNILSLVL